MPSGYGLRGMIGGSERCYPLVRAETSVGSAASSDIVLSLRGVSRRHALFSLERGGLVVEDLGSRNGVRVGGTRVTRAELHVGDEVALGPIVLRVEAASPAVSAPRSAQTPLSASRVETTSVRAATFAAGALVAQQVAGKAVRDALFLSSFDVSWLPSVMMAAAALAMLAVLFFSRLLAEYAPARVVPAAVAASAVLLGGEWALSTEFPRAAALLVYLHLAVFGGTLLSGFWSMVNESFDPYTAKRVLGRIGAGASFGGVAGGLLALGVARLVRVPVLLLGLAALNLIGFTALLRLRGSGDGDERAHEHDGPPSALLGVRILSEVPYLRDLALLVGLGAFGEALLDYSLKVQAAATLPKGQALMSFFALFYTAIGVLGLLVQSLLTRATLTTVGLAGTVALLPAVAGSTAIVGALAPRLATAALARGSQAVVHGSLFRTGYELLFTALGKRRKRPTKTLVDVGFDKLGGMLGGAAALAVVAVAPQAGGTWLFALCAAVALAALSLSRRLHRGYVAALEENLLSGAVHLDPEDVTDSTTRLAMAETGLLRDGLSSTRAAARSTDEAGADERLLRDAAALLSRDAGQVRAVLSRPPLDPRLAAFAIPLLARPELQSDALAALRRAAPRLVGQLGDALLDPGQAPAVRRCLPRVLSVCDGQGAADALLGGLSDDAFEVREACGVALFRISARTRVTIRDTTVFAAVVSELGAALPADPDGRGRRLDYVFNLLSVVLEREPLRVSLWAVRTRDPLRGTALEYLSNVLPDGVRSALWPLLGEGVAAPRRALRPAEQIVDELLASGSRAPRAQPDAE
jgi:hypothetical protein